MPRGRYQQQQWEQRETAILTALESLSAARGFAQVTMDDLADAVGISKATLYQHFESKDAMLIRLIARQTEAFLRWLDSTAADAPVERLRQTLRYLMDQHTLPLRNMLAIGLEDVLPVFLSSAALIEQHRRTVHRLIEVIQQGQAAGAITTAAAPGVIVRMMWALSSIPVAADTVLAHDLPTRDAIIDQVIALFEQAIQP